MQHFNVSENDLSQIQRRGDRRAAELYLAAIRRHLDRSDGHYAFSALRGFKYHVQRSGESLSALNISESELQALERQTHVMMANLYLQNASDDPNNRTLVGTERGWQTFFDLALTHIAQSGEPMSSFQMTEEMRQRISQLRLYDQPPVPQRSSDEVNIRSITDLGCVEEGLNGKGIQVSPKYLALLAYLGKRSQRPGQSPVNLVDFVAESIFNHGYCSTTSYGGIPFGDRALVTRVLARPIVATENENVNFNRFFGLNPRTVTNLGGITPGVLSASEAMDRTSFLQGRVMSGFPSCQAERETNKGKEDLRAAILSACRRNNTAAPAVEGSAARPAVRAE